MQLVGQEQPALELLGPLDWLEAREILGPKVILVLLGKPALLGPQGILVLLVISVPLGPRGILGWLEAKEPQAQLDCLDLLQHLHLPILVLFPQ